MNTELSINRELEKANSLFIFLYLSIQYIKQMIQIKKHQFIMNIEIKQ